MIMKQPTDHADVQNRNWFDLKRIPHSPFPVIIPVGVLYSGHGSTTGDPNSMKCNQRVEMKPISTLRTVRLSERSGRNVSEVPAGRHRVVREK
jgi:hypothetical protein